MGETTYKVENFLGGLNFSVSEDVLNVNETQNAQNVDISDGRLKTSLGFDYYSNSNLSGGIRSLMKFYSNGSNGVITSYLLASTDSAVYYLNGSTWTPILTGLSNGVFDYINYQKQVTDTLLLTNGDSGPYKWTGSGMAQLVVGKSPMTTLPKMGSLGLHRERVWGAVNKDDPNRLYFSDDMDFENWNAPIDENAANEEGGFFDIPTWDGSKIIGISTIFDDVVIFKNKSIHKIFGTYPKNFQLLDVYTTVGGIAEKSICHSSDRAFFLSIDGIYVYDGVNTKPLLDQKLTGITMNAAYEKNAVGIVFKNKLYMSIPEGSSTTNNAVIEVDLIKNVAMIRRGFEVNDFIEFNDTLLFANSTGYVYTYNLGAAYKNTGNNQISSYWETPATDMGYKNGVKNISSMYLRVSGTGQLKVEFIMDGVTKTAKLIDLTAAEKIIRKSLSYRGRLFKIRFSNVSGSTFILTSPEIVVDIDLD